MPVKPRKATRERRSVSRARRRDSVGADAMLRVWADMMEATDDPIAAVDADLKVIAANRAYLAEFERLFGWPLKVGDELGKALDHLPQARAAAEYLWRRAIAGELVDVPRSREAAPDGAYYDIKFQPLYDQAGKVVGAFQYSRNVTQRVRATERLREAQALLQRAQRMEALGQLTGGVAHDFNNLLQVISGNLQLLAKDVAGNARAERRIEQAMAGVERGSKLASQLLAFGRRQPLEPKVVNVGTLIAHIDEMLRRALGGEVQLQTVVPEGLWNTLVDPNRIDNAVLNLAINARDAMDARGQLTIEAANVVLDEAYARQNPEVQPGQYVLLAVTDTGRGMPPEVLDRAFEPFFTTKREGQGTGLGLSMVYGLVRQSGGHMKIYSEVGEGTTVKLYLPRTLAEAEQLVAPEPVPETGGAETILVAEDDDEVRATAVAMLEELGYRVLQAPDAARALALIEEGAEVDLLFTDVVMPGPIRTVDMVREASRRRPGLGVLYTSGYAENSIVHGGRLDAGVELLTKPYTREDLARKIRHGLARRPASGVGAGDPKPADGVQAGSDSAAT